MDKTSGSKKRKRDSSSHSKKGEDKKAKPFKSKAGSMALKSFKSEPVKPAMVANTDPKTTWERPLTAKEMAEEGKKKRKRNYNLEKVSKFVPMLLYIV